MYYINIIIIFLDIIAIIIQILNDNGNNLTLLIIILIVTFLNFLFIRKIFNKYNYLESSYFSSIKECSRLVKQEEFIELYNYLKNIRKSSWYRSKLENEGGVHRIYSYYQFDEYEIDFLEKK